MKVHELIEILKTHDPMATVEIETDKHARNAQPVTRAEKWGFFGHNTVILRTTGESKSKLGKHGEVVDMEPVTPKLGEQ